MIRINIKVLPWIGIWLFSFTGAMTAMKFLEQATFYQAVGIRFAWGSLLVSALLFKQKIIPFRTTQFPLHLLNATCRTLAVYCTYYAYSTLLMTFAASIGYTRPMMAMVLAMLLLKEKPHWHRWVAVLVGYIGVYLILNPEGQGVDWGLVAAILANVLASFSQITQKRLTRKDDNFTIMFYENALPLVISLGLGTYFWVEPTTFDYGLLALVALLGSFSQYSYVQSVRMADVSYIAPFEYLRILLATPIGFFLFDEIPTWAAAFGSALIIAASWFLTTPERRGRV